MAVCHLRSRLICICSAHMQSVMIQVLMSTTLQLTTQTGESRSSSLNQLLSVVASRGSLTSHGRRTSRARNIRPASSTHFWSSCSP